MNDVNTDKYEKVLLVTGASSDIGRELIRLISDDYTYIWAHYGQSSNVVYELAEEVGEKILPIQCDFSDRESVSRMADTIKASGRMPDHIVHLAAPRTKNERFHKFQWENYQQNIDISLQSIVILLESLVPHMAKQKYGKVVFMLTAYLIGVPPKYQSPYITVKYALYGLMKNLAAEYAASGIMVNAVSPEMTETKFLDEIDEHVVEINAENSPLKRNLFISDVIPAFKYLLSESADVVTGQNIGVTGGVRF